MSIAEAWDMPQMRQPLVPPSPPRASETMTALKRMAVMRESMIATWAQPAYEEDVIQGRFLGRSSFIINNPDSSLAVWLSMIPFTSPIAMLIRIPFGVPAWQLILSMLLLIGGFLFTTWVAARIYRVGILMYGKKASYKELAKWFMYKE